MVGCRRLIVRGSVSGARECISRPILRTGTRVFLSPHPTLSRRERKERQRRGPPGLPEHRRPVGRPGRAGQRCGGLTRQRTICSRRRPSCSECAQYRSGEEQAGTQKGRAGARGGRGQEKQDRAEAALRAVNAALARDDAAPVLARSWEARQAGVDEAALAERRRRLRDRFGDARRSGGQDAKRPCKRRIRPLRAPPSNARASSRPRPTALWRSDTVNLLGGEPGGVFPFPSRREPAFVPLPPWQAPAFPPLPPGEGRVRGSINP